MEETVNPSKIDGSNDALPHATNGSEKETSTVTSLESENKLRQQKFADIAHACVTNNREELVSLSVAKSGLVSDEARRKACKFSFYVRPNS
jgi:hypothetical protein